MIRSGGRVRRFPVKQKNAGDYQQRIRSAALAAWKKAGAAEVQVPASLAIDFVFALPKGATKALRTQLEQGIVPYVKRIDIDNCLKNVLDGLKTTKRQRGVIEDDSLFWQVSMVQMYSATSYTMIQIIPLTTKVWRPHGT